MADGLEAMKEISLLGLREGLKLALPDEQRAVNEYKTMAALARKINREDIAAALEHIQKEENGHYHSITKILASLE